MLCRHQGKLYETKEKCKLDILFYRNLQIKCRAGEWDTSNTDENFLTQERQVEKIVQHEDFFDRKFSNKFNKFK